MQVTYINHKEKCARLEKARAKASDALTSYAIANGHGMVRYSDLRAIADTELQKRLDTDQAATAKLRDAEHAAVAAGKAWFGTFNLLFWHA